jgi:cytochrome b subunit of formate dehydrogenase
MDDKKKKLRKMATWTIAVFATIFAVTFAVLWLPVFKLSSSALSAIGTIFSEAWLIILVDLVLCVGAYVGYKLYLDSKK